MPENNLDYLEKPVDSDELQPWQRLEIVFHSWTKKNDEIKDVHNDN